MPASFFSKILRRSPGTKSAKEQKYQGEVASTYLDKRAHKPGWHKEHLQMAVLMAPLPSGLKVLDVPFGTGRFMPLYVLKQWDVTGADLSPDMLAMARQCNPPDIVEYQEFQGDVISLPYGDNQFDVVVSFRFLGYILTCEKAAEAIRKLAKIARRHVIFQLQHLREGATLGPKDKMGHRMRWSEVEALLRDCNLTVVRKVVMNPDKDCINTILLLEKQA